MFDRRPRPMSPARRARLNRRCESYRHACLDTGAENDERLVTELAQVSPALAAEMARRLSGKAHPQG